MGLGRHREAQSDFVRLWMAQGVSEIGSRITREGLPMGAGLMMGVSPLAMSGLSLAIQVPTAVLGLFLGVVVDRLRRRPLMSGTDVLRAVLLMAIPFAALGGILRLWMFFVVGGLIGILTLLFDVASQQDYWRNRPGCGSGRNKGWGKKQYSKVEFLDKV